MSREKLGILVGGGPAPGINSVISAATIRALLQGVEVLGIRDGFDRLMKGKLEDIRPLKLGDVSRIHFTGGSILGTSRANPTKKEEDMVAVVDSLQRLGVTQLITIGGDDTSFSAMKVSERAAGKIRVVHVPKTIDNDLDLDPMVDTFGYQTARHIGVELVKNLMADAKTTSRWYFVVAMGRKAGHLALGIGKATGATMTVIPEEFPRGKTTLKTLVDILAGAVIKRLAEGRRYGVAVLAEGLAESIPEDDLKKLGPIERDDAGNIRLSELNLGDGLKKATSKTAQGSGREQAHPGVQRHRLRIALRRSYSFRHGVHPRLGLLRGQVPFLGRQRGHGVPAGGQLRAHPVCPDAGPRHRPHPTAHGGHALHPLRHRPALHDPAAARRLR